MSPRKRPPEIESSGLSCTGPVRADNQDSIYLPQAGQPGNTNRLYAVADGMGGYAHGALASQLALKALCEAVTEERAFSSPHRRLAQGMNDANTQVYLEAQRLGAGRMGTTLTAAYIHGDTLYLAHAGDSRLYLVRGAQATCLTRDHTTVGELARMKLIAPDKVRTHAQRSILTRAVGLALFLKADISRHRLCAEDRLILCSDGVWSVVQDEEFGLVACQAARAEETSRGLIDLALSRSTDDNVSAIAIHIRQISPAPPPPDPAEHSGWRHLVQKFNKKAL
ncbi:MAG TPA: protein phosphatase 2C domain-containing protein [Anaerolineales bacterium]